MLCLVHAVIMAFNYYKQLLTDDPPPGALSTGVLARSRSHVTDILDRP